MEISTIHKGRVVWTAMELSSSFRNYQPFANLVSSTLPFIYSFLHLRLYSFIYLLLFFAEIFKNKSLASYYFISKYFRMYL